MARRQGRQRPGSAVYPDKLRLKEDNFVTKRSFHAQPNTIQHWQLRDLLSTSDVANQVYCVYGTHTLRYDTHYREAMVVQELSYPPTSMTVGHNFLASGGQQGQLDVYNLAEGKSVYSGAVGDNVNNSLHVGRSRTGEKSLLVSNNDCTIKVLNLPTLQSLASFSFPIAINYSSMSPDGDHLVCVGDSEQVYLYNTRGGRGAGEYQRVNTFCEASDSGMSCAWNASGTCFAAGNQDGSVCVWDVRMQRLLAKLHASRAVRSVKFSRGAVDLLVYSEHENACHVVDARTFHTEQVLQMATVQTEISGLAFDRDGTRLFVGLGDQGIVEYEVDSIGRRSFACGELL